MFLPRIGKFPGSPYKFQIKPNAKPTRHAPRKVPIHLQEAFHEENQESGSIRNIGRDKMSQRWVNSFVIVEKKVPNDSSNEHSPWTLHQEKT